ncbi:hypothetical protein LTR36_001189 [Oleoguttula mirabilis]|uniref:AAA+ ATPase domain-containing protein n=1 Tax=Oleoguttula mirabilis TaxID=1507867 RepID=A0AAV9J3A8_9PEZI|nr:hypothetical protein LTR36_001189 [Oleoguttula mirabilis]
MNGGVEKHIHPFFRPPNAGHERHEDAAGNEAKAHADEQEPSEEGVDGAQDQAPKAKRKRKSNGPAQSDANGKKQKTLQDIVNAKGNEQQNGQNGGQVIDLCSSDPVVDLSRRKRRRTGEPTPIDVEVEVPVHAPSPSSPRVVISPSSPLPQRAAHADVGAEQPAADAPATPPKKVLKLNANGKFSSPISKKDKQDEEQASPAAPKRRGRPRKSKEAAGPKKLLVTLTYGEDEARRTTIAQRIESILAGEERISTSTPKKQSTLRRPRTPKKPAKSTHPFFTGKPNDPPPAPKHEIPRKMTATTPGKLRRQVFGDRQPEVKEAPYACGSGLLKDRLMVKHPGAREPLWPDREQTHVRGLSESDSVQHASSAPGSGTVRQRKGKTARIPFASEQSILRQFAFALVPEEECVERDDGFHEPHSSLRLPEKLLISGRDIRQRITPELSVPLHDDAEGELSLPTSSQLSAHQALYKLWSGIPTTLTAFDQSRGENLPWTQKHAPAAAAEVLQPAREMAVLRDWLTSLTINAVESTSAHPPRPVAKAELKPRKKRRPKPDDLDDFLVDSDEEIHNMDELADPEDVPTVSGSKAHKSVIQVAAEGAKLSNAVLLSGPHGCGKTAAAYAVAKELGFKVFEISAHERRSGKDVLDKVGDMTENHLVKHHGVDTAELSSAEEPNAARLDEAFQQDLASGRQGKMNAFFKPKASAKPAVPKQKATAKAKTLESVHKAIKKPPRDQQQSLILLEEVDILFKDDKDFWNTVLKLIATSKRPFIMTCNDEDLVPLQAMTLHAILRFSPPPADLATDYMLLVAATEGHLLKREAVASLYESKGHDIRASITELDLWCQMGVGDPRGGLSWIFQRWPPGCDLDSRSQKLRVVSHGTYQSDIGLVAGTGVCEEEQMFRMWKEFGVDPTALLDRSDRASISHKEFGDSSTTPQERSAALKRHAALAETLSSLDAYTTVGLENTAPLDTTQPLLSDKARHHYVEGLPLLQTDEMIDYTAMSMHLVVTTVCLLSRGVLSADSSVQLPAQGPRRLDRVQSQDTALPWKSRSDGASSLTRRNFACFDAISVSTDNTLASSVGLIQSAFDGPLHPIAIDVAPYVRSIVQYDLLREEQRERLNSLLADGDGRKAKRARTTRAARSALEGGQRASTRRERWFTKGLDLQAVLATGGTEWPKTTLSVRDVASIDGSEAPASSAETG